MRTRGRLARRGWTSAAWLAGAALVAALLSACGTAPSPSAAGGPIRVVAAEDFWGSIAAQLGGDRVRVTSIITNPATDPHSYEPTAADARTVAGAALVIENGIGYDSWAAKLRSADSSDATVLDVGALLHLPAGANPHRWYNPSDVQTVMAALIRDYARLDPGSAGYFRSRLQQFENVTLTPYHRLVNEIRARYAGTPVGASESIFAMLAPSLGLDLITPYSFLRAVSEGDEVTVGDKATIDGQIRRHLIRIYVFNSQNVTPDVSTQLAEVRAEGIPTATITETLQPASSTYQAWQVRELEGILSALARAASP